MTLWACAGFALGGFAAGWGLCAWMSRRRERLRADLLSFVGHELNNPVLAMNLTVMNFLDGLFGPVPDDQRTWLVLFREQVARMAALVGDMRDLIHHEFHQDLRLTPEPADFVPLLRRTLETMEQALARSGSELLSEVPEELPKIRADEDRLLRVLSAALTQARKFRTKGPIRLSAAVEDRWLRFFVDYQGLPFPGGDPARAMDLFYPAMQADSQVLASTGLGLGMARALLEAQGGSMDFSVDAAGSSRVAMRLPRVEE